MSEKKTEDLQKIMNSMEGVDLHEKKGGRFRFPLYLDRQMAETSIESLDLSPRSYNSLKRAGFSTVGEVVESVSSGMSLKAIRNCGSKSAREIMESLFLLQYQSIKPEKRDEYLLDVVRMNIGGGVEEITI